MAACVLPCQMDTEEKTTARERDQTDESLRAERENTDQTLADTQVAVDSDADEVVRRAREAADAVLEAAREKADDQLDRPNLPCEIAEERLIEDESLREERASADASLNRVRKEDAHALMRLLPLEREATDRHLLTERARSDDAIANRDDFLGMVCHDLRDLLGGIVMSSSLLSSRASESEEGKRAAAAGTQIQRYAARMNRLIGDLVDVVSIDAGKLSVTGEGGDPDALVAEAVAAFRDAASAKGLSLDADRASQPVTAQFDHDRMLQVLANLITNSIKFTPKGGAIRIQCEHARDELRFCVSDTGPGVPADMLEAVFERFWQVGKNDRRGLGLGLYISKCIVEAHGGRIWAESEPGRGSRFWFTLPMP